MNFRPALIQATLHKRYKRFLADVTLHGSGEKITAYVPNTGSMLSCLLPEATVALSYHPDSDRKLPYTLEMVHSGSTWIGINTNTTNNIVDEAIQQKKIRTLEHFEHIQREVSIFSSRIDFLLTDNNQQKLYLEVKNVSYKNEELQNTAQFPDAVTTRGLKHLEDLIKIKESGVRAGIFYLIQREDVQTFSIADHIDKNYAIGFKNAVKHGVEIFVYQAKVSPEKILVTHEVPWNH